MALNISTPLADKWERVPEKYKKLVNEGKMTYQEAFKYAEEAPRTSSVQPKKSLDTTEAPRGSALEDAALALRTGTNTTTSGVVGTPAALINAIAEPKWVGQMSQFAEDVTGKPVPNIIQMGRALLDDNNKSGVLDTITGGASPEAYGARTLQQPDAVRGIQESLSVNSEQDVSRRSSPSLKKGLEAMSKSDTALDAVKAMIDNPEIAPYLVTQQIPNLVINRVPGSTAATVAAQAINSGASADSQVYEALQEEVKAGRMTKEEAEKRSSEAGQRSTLINIALPSVFGKAGRVTERVLAGQVSKEVAKDAIKKSVVASAAKATGVNAAEEFSTEGLEQVSQNLGTGDPLLKGAGASGAFGALTGATFGGPSGAIETVVQNKQIDEHQKVLAEFDKQQKELEDSHNKTVETAKASEELKKQVDAVAEGKAPVIQDLFTSEAIPAEQVAAKAEAALAQNTAEATNPETAPTIPRSPEQQMEVDNRVVDTLKKQEAGKAKKENNTVNTLVTEELAKREQVKQAEDIVKNKYDIVNVMDISQEANQRMKAELDAIAQRPGNRTAEGQKLLPEILARREALRLPEIKEQVKNERLAKVEQATSFLKQEEEAQVRKEVETKVAKEQEAKAPEQATLTMKYPQQPQPKARGYTGTMTPVQKVSEAKDMAFKKELASLPPEQAKVLLEETNKAEKAAVAQEKKQEKVKTAAYMAAKSNARSSIAAEVSSSMPEADGKTKSQEIGRRMLEWNTKNPEEAFKLPEVRKAATLTQKFEAKDKAKESKAKAKETRARTKQEDKLYETYKAQGMDPAEAARKVVETMSSDDVASTLPKDVEASVREQLKSSTVKPRKDAVEANRVTRAKIAEDTPGLSETIEEGLENGKEGLLDILSYMATTDTVREDYGRLAARMIPIVKKLDMQFHALPDDVNVDGYRGVYNPDMDAILIGDNHPETILHETLHAISYHILEGTGAFANNATAKQIRMKMAGLTLHMDRFIKANQEVFTLEELKYIEKNALANNGQLTDIHELLAYTMTNTLGQGIALKIPSTGRVKAIVDNIIDAFVRSIGTIFNFKPEIKNTALYDVTMLGAQILDIVQQNPEQVIAARDAQVARQTPKPSKDTEEAPRPVLKRTSKIVEIGGKDFVVANISTQNSLMGKLKDMLTQGHGSSKNVTESLARAQGLVGEYLQRAKARFDTQEDSLRKRAAAQGKTLSELMDSFSDAVTKLEAATEVDIQTAMKEALVRNYGDAARAYFANRLEIDKITNMIIDTRLEDPTPLSPKEAAIYLKMKQELGKYYTRAYASNLEGIKEKYKKSMLDAYKAKQKGTATKHEKELAATMEAAIDVIEKTFVSIPDTDAMVDMKMDQLKAIADGWDIKVPVTDEMSMEERKDAYIDALDNHRATVLHMDPELVKTRAVALAEELLSDAEGSSLVTYMRGGKQNRTVVEARAGVPEAIRKFLGEYDDVALKGLTTVLKQAQFVFQTRALGEILESEQAKGDTSKVLTVQQFTERGISPKDWVQVTEDSFGPLRGYYIEKSLHNRLGDLRELTSKFEALIASPHAGSTTKIVQQALAKTALGWMKLTGNIKFLQLVVNLTNVVYNFVGGPFTLASNGVVARAPVMKAFGTALKLIAAQGNSVVDPEVSRMIRTNQVDSAYMGTLRATEMEKVKLVLLAKLGEEGAADSLRTWQKTKEYGRMAKEVYAMADVVWKLAAFYNRMDVLTNFHEANGDNLTEEQIEREAAADNSIATFSYSHVPKILQAIEKGGITYILPFVYESFRAPIGSFLLGASDMKVAAQAKTPAAKVIMARHAGLRLAGSAATLTFAGTMTKAIIVALSDAISGDDDEEKNQELIEKLRPLMADYQKFNDFLVAGKDSSGKYVLFDWSRLDPYGMATEFYRMAANDATPEEYLEYIAKLPIKNRYGASLIGAVMSLGDDDAKAAKGTRMENFARPDFIPQDWTSMYEGLSSVLGSKSVRAIDKLLPSWPAKAFDTRNEAFDVLSGAIKYSGGEMTKVDPEMTLQFAVRDYDEQKKLAVDSLKKVLRTEEVLTKEEYAKAWVEASQIEKEAYTKLAEKHQALMALGYSRDQATAYLMRAGTGGKGLAKKDANEIAKGTYRAENSLLLSEASLKSIKEEIAFSNESPAIKAKMARNYNASLEAIKEYNLPVRSK